MADIQVAFEKETILLIKGSLAGQELQLLLSENA